MLRKSKIEIQQIIEKKEFNSLSFEDEKYLLEYLRKLPEIEAFDVVLEMIKKNVIYLRVARQVLRDKNLVIKLLKHGLKDTDAQEIKLWN
ncbi:MAG: hypothetical protein F6K32_17495 [Desertifilum sp. SIO1I2]|nr:hypothetical protein [Desertifilum sp. SIO1I2]